MGQQLRKRTKRAARKRYNKRQREAVREAIANAKSKSLLYPHLTCGFFYVYMG